MKPDRLVLAGFIACLVPLIAAVGRTPVPVVADQAQAPKQVIEVKATKYEFAPNKIDIALNASVIFKVTAVDHDHGFEIEGVKDSCVKIPKGETKTIEYQATKAGTVKFKCCDFCGLGHGKMNGTIAVK
jgi:heme/copper-type cytochrome/quinol oxidase subunit 2